MADALKTLGTRTTPQSKAADPGQHRNEAGGFVFTTSREAQINRFLTMGVTGSTYHVGQDKLGDEALALVQAAIRDDGPGLVSTIVEISTAGRAPKQNPALFALAAASALGDDETRSAAYGVLNVVARTASALFTFAQYRSQFAGWSRGYRTAVSNWYLNRSVDKLAYQMVKYRQRDGWDHRRLLQTAHPKPDVAARDGLFRWALGKGDPNSVENDGHRALDRPHQHQSMPAVWLDFIDAQRGTPDTWPEIIARGNGLSWEMLPTKALTHAEVWEALIHHSLPIGALLRQLPRLTNLGLVTGETGRVIRARLTNSEVLERGRIHPINVLAQTHAYRSGRGRGQSWVPDGRLIDALDEAFYKSFGAVRPSGKRILLALDVSASMAWPQHAIGNMGGITPREASAALTLVTMNTESNWDVVAFTAEGHRGRGYDYVCSPLPLSPRQRLDDVVRSITGLPAGGTDCAQPFIWAKSRPRERDYDAVVIYTDNQTWAGSVHPHQALRSYREVVGHDVAMIVVAMTPPLNHTIADPRDPRTLDVSGLDAAVPNLISDFARGDVA